MNQAKRQFALDIETTGLSPGEGHRIVEIAAIELLDGAVTGYYFHHRLNPECEIEEKVSSIIGWTWDMLKSEPRFAEVAGEFMEFIAGAELILHHAPFDLGFLNAELSLSGLPELTNPVIDTLEMARKLHPAQKNHLNALCKRYSIDQTHPEWHGLLLDVKAIADVYLAMLADRKSFSEGGGDNACESTEEGKFNLLDLAEARSFVDNHQISDDLLLDLLAYRRATPAALEFLAMQENYKDCDVVLGVENLDETAARVLAWWSPCCLDFENLRYLNESVASILAEPDSYLKFANLDEISPLTAKLLAEVSLLDLRLGNISMEVVNELVKQKGYLCLTLGKPPEESILHALSHHAGGKITIHWQSPEGSEPFDVKLPIGKKMEQRSSTFIASSGRRNESVGIVWDIGDCSNAPEVYETEYKHLDLVEANRLCEEKILVKGAEDKSLGMELYVYTSATHEALEFLASHIRNDYVNLSLCELDADMARILCRWDAYIEFLNVKHLDLETALILSERTKGISFHGKPFQIGAEVAEALANIKPPLGLVLEELTVDVAQELVKKPDRLWLRVVAPPSEQILHMLCEHMGSWLDISWVREAGADHRNFKPSHEILESKEVTIGFDLCTDGAWIDRVHIRNLDNED